MSITTEKKPFTDEKRWSDTVADYYPVNPRPRFGQGLPPHAGIAAILEAARDSYEPALAEVAAAHDVLHAIGHHEEPPRKEGGTAPTWNNRWFTSLDAASLVGLLLARKPARYLEIGSGNSTKFARFAIEQGGSQTELISIDPRPRAEIDKICSRLIRSPLEECDLAMFDELAPGDILFFDGSHRVFTNSDVTVFFLEILPRLPSGVLVHIHDIFLPDDYPKPWNRRLYSEQYMLAAQLLCGAPPFKIVLPAYFVSCAPLMGARVMEIFRSKTGGTDIPMNNPFGRGGPGTSFWMTTHRIDGR